LKLGEDVSVNPLSEEDYNIIAFFKVNETDQKEYDLVKSFYPLQGIRAADVTADTMSRDDKHVGKFVESDRNREVKDEGDNEFERF
jgi:hypothetical protein